MASAVQNLLDSMNPHKLTIVQSETSTRDILALDQDQEFGNMFQSFGNGDVAKFKRDKVSTNNAKGKSTRPLNSFMAFRCYYSVLFEELEQKVISTYIVFLWEHDPCKAKWALAAKAYSVIRDQVGKEHAPLDVFLMLVAEFLGLIKPQHYLTIMGWEISVNEVGTVSLVKDDETEIDKKIRCTNLSVKDVVIHACHHGYAGATASFEVTPSDKPIMAMAASGLDFGGSDLMNRKRDRQEKTQQVATIQGGSDTATTSHPAEFTNVGNTINVANDHLTAVSPFNPGSNQSSDSSGSANQSLNGFANSSLNQFNPIDSAGQFTMDDILDFDLNTDEFIYNPQDGAKWDVFDLSAWVHPDAYTD
ncbi:MAG: hypothetical protein Q9219_003051 [cf. Caloplaca sp. 3 TL-2023]